MQRKYNHGFRSLIVWQEAKKLANTIYDLTKTFPKDEQFVLVSQLRRAATLVMANIAEGSSMPTKAHRDSFYFRARGSVVEVDCFIEFAADRKYLIESKQHDIQDHCARLTYLLTKLIQSK